MRKYAPYIFIVGLFLCLYGILQIHPVRWDLTEDRRYSLSEATKQMLRSLDEPIYVGCLLEGELNSGFRKLRQAEEDLEREIGIYANVRKLVVSDEQKQSWGLRPTLIHERKKNGQTAQTEVYPYAVLAYKGRKAVVPLLSNNRSLSGEENLNNSIAGLEYSFAEAIHHVQVDSVPKIAFLEGHGELPEVYVADITMMLSRYFEVDRGVLGNDAGALDNYKVVIIADPQEAFSEKDKYILDQYVMRGGRVLWLINGVKFSNEVLTREGYTPAMALDLRLSDMLFRYGVRIEPALVQDVQCLPVPVDVSGTTGEPNYQPMPWYYAPLLLTSQASPITRNCMQVSATFASPVVAVGESESLKKEILLASSTASRLIATPAQVDLTDMNPDMSTFKYQFIPVGVSIEGSFPSAFAHRLAPEGLEKLQPQQNQSVPTRQIVIGAGSVIRNEREQGSILPAGYDRYSGMQFGNRDVLVNSVLWLTDDEGLMELRQKEVTLRLLNDQRAHDLWTRIQIVTIVVPLVILALVAGIVTIVRRKKFIIQN